MDFAPEQETQEFLAANSDSEPFILDANGVPRGKLLHRDALDRQFLGVYLAIKRVEYRQFMGEVGEQDWRWCLTQA